MNTRDAASKVATYVGGLDARLVGGIVVAIVLLSSVKVSIPL